MKRSFFAAMCIACLILMLGVLVFVPTLATAQGSQDTPTPTVTSTAVAPSTATLSPADILAQAQQASDNADKTNNNANQAMNLVNSMLSFIQVAGIIIGALAAATGALLTTAGIRTIQDYSAELEKARTELDATRDQLKAQSEEIRVQSNNAIRALSIMQLGEQQLESKNMKSALRTYLEAYALDPENSAINYFLGYLYTQEQDIEKGIEHLKRSLTPGGHFPPAEAALAYALRLQADRTKDPAQRKLGYVDAERMFLKALGDDPAVRDINGESVYAVLGGLYKKQGRIDEAIQAYHEAEFVTPQNSYPIVNLAMLHFTQGHVEESESYFNRSSQISTRTLDANPFDYWSRFDLTIAMLVLGKFADAHKNLDIAIKQVHNAVPLETFLSDLKRLRDSPQPPKQIAEYIEKVENAIQAFKVPAAAQQH
ncbi:MAG: tetratricopeptide repeat protein [Chloroflexota bacterium]